MNGERKSYWKRFCDVDQIGNAFYDTETFLGSLSRKAAIKMLQVSNKNRKAALKMLQCFQRNDNE